MDVRSNSNRNEKKAELRRRLKAMEEARRGKTMVSNTKETMSKKERRKMKKVVKSSQVDELLKQFNITDEATKTCFKKAIQEGRISNMEDLAKFLSKQTNSNVTTNDLMQSTNDSSGSNSETTLQQSQREAQELLNLPISTKVTTGYENDQVPKEKRRPTMAPPSISLGSLGKGAYGSEFFISEEDLDLE